MFSLVIKIFPPTYLHYTHLLTTASQYELVFNCLRDDTKGCAFVLQPFHSSALPAVRMISMPYPQIALYVASLNVVSLDPIY